MNSTEIQGMLPDIDVLGALTAASGAVFAKYGTTVAIVMGLGSVPIMLALMLWVVFYVIGKLRKGMPK